MLEPGRPQLSFVLFTGAIGNRSSLKDVIFLVAGYGIRIVPIERMTNSARWKTFPFLPNSSRKMT